MMGHHADRTTSAKNLRSPAGYLAASRLLAHYSRARNRHNLPRRKLAVYSSRMRQIPGAKLWIGNEYDGGNTSALEAAGIAAVVNLASGPPAGPTAAERSQLHFPLIDAAGNPSALLRQAIDAVDALIRDNVPTLVCCTGWTSRSAAIAAAAMAQVTNRDATQTLVEICSATGAEVGGPLWMDIYSLMHNGESFVFKMPPRAQGRTPKKEKPSGKRGVWPLVTDHFTPPSPPASPPA